MAKPLRKAKERLRLRRMGVDAKPAYHMPGSQNRHKTAPEGKGPRRR